MNDSSPPEPKSSPFGPPTGSSAPSPYDNPTEEFPETASSVPRTDDELGGTPTEFLPSRREDLETRPTYSFASIPPSTVVPGETRRGRRGRGYDASYGRGTVDLGLLLLRLVVGGTFVYTGLQKTTGWWHGGGIDATRHAFEHMGWKRPKLSAILAASGELGGGALVVVGLVTPLAAAALVGVAINAWLTLQNAQHGLAYNIDSGIVLIVVLGVGAAAIILTGPGRIALDGGRGWATQPRSGSFFALVAAIIAAALVWIFLHGDNPFRTV